MFMFSMVYSATSLSKFYKHGYQFICLGPQKLLSSFYYVSDAEYTCKSFTSTHFWGAKSLFFFISFYCGGPEERLHSFLQCSWVQIMDQVLVNCPSLPSSNFLLSLISLKCAWNLVINIWSLCKHPEYKYKDIILGRFHWK